MQQTKFHKLLLMLTLIALAIHIGCSKSGTSNPDQTTEENRDDNPPQPPSPTPTPAPNPQIANTPRPSLQQPPAPDKIIDNGYEFLGDTKLVDFIKQHATYREIELLIGDKSIHILYVGYAYNKNTQLQGQQTWFYNHVYVTDSKDTYYFLMESNIDSSKTIKKSESLFAGGIHFPKNNGEDPRRNWIYTHFKNRSPVETVRIDQKTWLENGRIEYNFSRSKCLDVYTTARTLEVTGMIHFKDMFITDRHARNRGMFFMFDVETAEFLLLQANNLNSNEKIIKITSEPGQAFRKYIRKSTEDLFKSCNVIYSKAFPEVLKRLNFKNKEIALSYNEEFEKSDKYEFKSLDYDTFGSFYFNYNDERSLLLDLPIESNLTESDKKILRENGFKIMTREELIK